MPTINIALSELQTALYTRLSSILSVGVGDHIDENTTFSYASIGEFNVTPFRTKSSGSVYTVGTINIWSKYEGMKECQDIAATVCASLTGNDLDITDPYSVRDTELESFTTVTEDHGTELVRHGTLVIRWWIT